MGLKQAANFFARTPIYGWDGTQFVLTDAKGSLQPYDRFVSEREFGNKRRMLLVDPETPIPDSATVIKLGVNGPVYMRGFLNKDIFAGETYSLVYLICIAASIGTLVSLAKTPKASGMAFNVVDSPQGNWHCSEERVTFSNSPEFSEMRITDASLTLPANCPANADHEFILGSKRYVLQEVYKTAGFVQARAQVKNG